MLTTSNFAEVVEPNFNAPDTQPWPTDFDNVHPSMWEDGIGSLEDDYSCSQPADTFEAIQSFLATRTSCRLHIVRVMFPVGRDF